MRYRQVKPGKRLKSKIQNLKSFVPHFIAMLKPVARRSRHLSNGRFAIVASRYNPRYADALLRAARRELTAGGAASIEVFRVPGAFEIPAIASTLANVSATQFSAILCLGVIFQGETAHARQIGDAVSHALVELQIRHQLPVIHGVYLFENEQQAKVRCLGREHNRGTEVARTALEMARLKSTLDRRFADDVPF
jgi:6,7-dimethyl-8-ribityllumazine synthase